MRNWFRFGLLTVALLALGGCSIVQSLNTATVEQVKPNEVRVTTLSSGLLTIASTQIITAIRGADLQPCSLESTFRGEAHGVICKAVQRGFVVNIETLGTVAARVTQTPSSSNLMNFELDKTARGLE